MFGTKKAEPVANDPAGHTQTIPDPVVVIEASRQPIPIVPAILWSGTSQIPATGMLAVPVSDRYASIHIANLGTGDMTVVGGGPDISAPVEGAGVHIVRGATTRVIGLEAKALTIWGTAGERCSIVLYTAPQPPSSGPC